MSENRFVFECTKVKKNIWSQLFVCVEISKKKKYRILINSQKRR
jgi:hypothetical protein